MLTSHNIAFLLVLIFPFITIARKVQMAEAINLGDKDLLAQLHETLRCVRRFDNSGCTKLIHR